MGGTMKPMLSLKKRIDSGLLLKEARQMADRIVASVNPIMVVCFGSVATGSTTDQSDIDLLIVLDDLDNIMEARRKFLPFRKDYSVPLDLIWMNVSDYNRKKNIGGIAMIAHEDGIILYEKGIV